jgi:tRNA threonylcarbamoyladenosine biosynthesis protein TsaB
MIILALETATEACSAALAVDDDIRERFEVSPRGHSQLILPMINELLAEAQLAIGQVDAIAFGRGPGAFTGLRIAVGVTQGIAFAADLPVVPVSTLAALAQDSDANRVLAAIDARMDEVYWGAFQRDDSGLMTACGEEAVLSPSAVIPPEGSDWQGIGSGWDSYHSELAACCAGHIVKWEEGGLPRAGDVARLGLAAFRRGEGVSADHALPVYLRDEVAWKKSHK